MNRVVIRLALALCAFAIGAGFGCNRTDQAEGPLERVTIACATPPYTALVDIALAKGYFRQKGLDATPYFHSTGKAALDEVLAGKADFATVADTPVVFAVMNGDKISIIATIQSSNKTNAILARKDRGIHAPKDLKGRRIGVPLGTVGDYFLDAFLATHGVARKDIELVDLKPEETVEALVKGEIDAASTWPPFLNQAQNNLGDKGATFYHEDIYTQTFNLVATQEQIRDNPARIRKMLLALIEGEEFVLRNPGEAQKVIADFRQVDMSVLEAIWAEHAFGVTLEQSLLLALEDESQWAIRKGLTNAREVPNYLHYIYFDGLKAVKPEAVRILK